LRFLCPDRTFRVFFAPKGNAVKHFFPGKLGFRDLGEHEKGQIPCNHLLKRFSQKGIWPCLAGSENNWIEPMASVNARLGVDGMT
jgi:hypothetical protein